MRQIVGASHSLLAQGFKDTLEFLTGKGDAVNAVCAYVNDNGEGLDAAAAAVALHLDSFWTPAMKADLVEHASTGAGGLAPAVLAALELISVDA